MAKGAWSRVQGSGAAAAIGQQATLVKGRRPLFPVRGPGKLLSEMNDKGEETEKGRSIENVWVNS